MAPMLPSYPDLRAAGRWASAQSPTVRDQRPAQDALIAGKRRGAEMARRHGRGPCGPTPHALPTPSHNPATQAEGNPGVVSAGDAVDLIDAQHRFHAAGGGNRRLDFGASGI